MSYSDYYYDKIQTKDHSMITVPDLYDAFWAFLKKIISNLDVKCALPDQYLCFVLVSFSFTEKSTNVGMCKMCVDW